MTRIPIKRAVNVTISRVYKHGPCGYVTGSSAGVGISISDGELITDGVGISISDGVLIVEGVGISISDGVLVDATPAAIMTFAPTALAFPATDPGASAELTVTVTNTGDAAGSITGFSVTGTAFTAELVS